MIMLLCNVNMFDFNNNINLSARCIRARRKRRSEKSAPCSGGTACLSLLV